MERKLNFKFGNWVVNIDKIRDTAGQEKFRTVTTSYYRGASGVLLIYDLTNDASLTNLKLWLDEVKRYCEKAPIVLVGNKVDASDKKVDQEAASKFATVSAIDKHFLTSAKTGEKVEEAFMSLTSQVVSKVAQKGGKTIDFSNSKPQKPASKC